MKKLIIICILGFSTFSVMYSQAVSKDNVTQSNVEKFSSKSGALMQKEFHDIGVLGGAEIQVLKYTDLIANENFSGVRIKKDVATSYSTDSKIAVLDADEIDGLIKSIKIIQAQILPSTKAVYTEISFTSRSGFECGCYYTVDKAKWTAYIKIEKYDSNSYVWLKAEDLVELLSLLEQAKLKL